MSGNGSKRDEARQEFEQAFDDEGTREMAGRWLAKTTDGALAVWGDRETVIATGLRIRTMLPGGDALSIPQALAAGQYAIATGLNPFRGEFYPMVDKKNQLHLVDGYKALTRWAEDECPYDAQYEDLEPGEGEAHRVQCTIFRHDRREQLEWYLSKGAPWDQAWSLVTTSAVGVVDKKDTTYPSGDPKDPPKGWTWGQRAEIRALKNALNRSHGMPTMAELAERSWKVNGVQTRPEDWEDAEEMRTTHEREQLAYARAMDRAHLEAWNELTPDEQAERQAHNSRVLYGEETDDPFGDAINGEKVEPIEEPEPEHPLGPFSNTELQRSIAHLLAGLREVTDHYTNSPHVWQALLKVYGEDFRYPHPRDAEAWAGLKVALVERVEEGADDAEGD